jgi:hypothetical protein
VLTLLTVAPAGATSAWLAPVNLSAGEGQGASEPRVAFDARGDAMTVWSRNNGANDTVQATFRLAGGTWQAPVNLSLRGQSANEPQVVLDGQGDAIAVWDAYNGVTFNVQAAFRPAGGAWQESAPLSAEEIPGADTPQVAVDSKGDAIAIWHRGGPFGGAVQTAFRPVDGTWQAPAKVSELGFDPQITFDAQGNALAVWEHYDGSNYIVQSASKPVGVEWQTPVNVSEAGETAERPQVAVDDHGNAIAVWHRWTDGLFSTRIVQAAFRPAGAEAWQAPVNISEPGATNPQIAFDGQGNAIAVWSGNGAAFKPAGGPWQAPVELEPGGEAQSPQVAFDGHGNALVVWPSSNRIQAATRSADGVWQAPVTLFTAEGAYDPRVGAYDPQVAFDEQGDAVTVWDHDNGTSEVIESAGYVAAVGPHLNSLSIPTTSVVGKPVTLSVSSLDVWSVLGETSWNFGDSTSATGTSVTHTYTSAGSYEVLVRSTDMFGNTTSASGTITIAPEPPSISTSSSSAPPSEPPTIGAASQTVSTWRESGKAPVGTTFSLSLNEQATVSISFLQGVRGRMVGHRCVGKPAKGVKRGECRRTIVAGTLSLIGHRGKNKVAFQGRISRLDVLKPGRYKSVVTATNPAGTSTPRFLYFTVIM